MMKSSISNGSPTKRSNNLVYQVEDNFDFEQNNNDLDSILQRTNSTISSANGGAQVNAVNVHEKKNGVRLLLDNTIKQSVDLNDSNNAPSYFNANFDENGYVFDGVKIDIEDIDNTSVSNITTQSLKRCKSQVLKHFYRLLCFIGWRPFYKERYYATPFVIMVINMLYPLTIISLLFYAYAYDIYTCQSRLNIVTDTGYVKPFTFAPAVTKAPDTTPTPVVTPDYIDGNNGSMVPNLLNGILNMDSKRPNLLHLRSLNQSVDKDAVKKKDDQCGHVMTTYILPSLMHLISYILGFIYFRINENEQLYALMEKVFLAVNQTLKTVSQDRVIKRLKVFIICGVLWVIMATSLHIFSRAAFGLEREMFQPQWASTILEAIALVILNSVYLAVIINHSTQCEMIIFYVNEIRTRLEEKSITLKDAMQQILDIRVAIGNLNSTVSKMTTLVALIFIEKFIIGLIILVLNRVFNPYAWTYRGLFAVSWFLILSFTLVQVARLNSKCSKFKQIALSARVYGYHASSRDELDSFVLFISNARLRAKLFGVPLKPSLIAGSLILILFIIIILIQTSVITLYDSMI